MSPLVRSLSSLSTTPTAAATASLSSSSKDGETEVLLLRDYISRRLTGYFSAPASSSPVGELAKALERSEGHREPTSSSIDFPSLSGRSAYEHALSDLYRGLAVSWLTPSELFSPHYGRAVARFVAEDAKAKMRMPKRRKSDEEGEEANLCVVEVGAGRGTLAADFLDYLAEVEPALYLRTRYVSLEVSPPLARAQEEKVRSKRRHGSSRFSSVIGNATDRGSWRRAAAEAFKGGESGGEEEGHKQQQNQQQQQHLYVLAFEVLDDLTHDRVVLESLEEEEEKGKRKKNWLQTFVEVEAATGRPLKELLAPASDPFISLCLSASQRWQERGGEGAASNSVVVRFFDSLFSFVGAGGSRNTNSGREPTFAESHGEEDLDSSSEIVVFLPTGAASMLSSLFSVAPDHTIVAADFDALPGVAVAGANAPLVSATRGGVARDFSSLYSPPVGEAVDIFFPTNFEALSDLYVECAKRSRRKRQSKEEEREENDDDDDDEEEEEISARHCKSSSYLSLAADTAAFSRGAVSTASGWSPMLDDWKNTTVLVARSQKRKKNKDKWQEEVEERKKTNE